MTIDQALAPRLAPTGVLRAVINLGNPVLAHGTPEEPGGITVAIARELADRLGVPLALECVDAARRSLAGLTEGTADVAFLAVEPAREVDVRFSPPYLTIEGVYVVALDSPVATAADVDRPGVRVGVKQGSAYDLFLTRTLEHAEVVRGSDGVAVYRDEGLDVGAGIRQPLTALVADEESLRLVEPAFMQIQQAVALPRDRGEEAADALAAFVHDLLDSGFVRQELAAADQDPGLAAD
ncbi:transporter substrate-binding domain-containing protein [Nocardioides lijunqiniae]|uniref:transporter substrate-binding domain-containing protein n=1 Tax=Nocardioides lijunqiniae TaxID=2760832 RepID=UPI001877E2E2|nr:transporter substrate-binding domain-containing protein [Nocardioides lijunqiniae]